MSHTATHSALAHYPILIGLVTSLVWGAQRVNRLAGPAGAGQFVREQSGERV